MNACAIGKVLAAYHNFDRVTELLNSMTFIKLTQNTIVNHDAILEEYQTIRRQGYAIGDEERFLDSFGIAVPIKDKNENVWSCISITAPKSRLTPDKLNSWIYLLKDKV